MSGKRDTDEFKIEAVKQVTERGHSVAEVADRLGHHNAQFVRMEDQVRPTGGHTPH